MSTPSIESRTSSENTIMVFFAWMKPVQIAIAFCSFAGNSERRIGLQFLLWGFKGALSHIGGNLLERSHLLPSLEMLFTL